MCLHHPEWIKPLPKKLSKRVYATLSDFNKHMQRIIGPNKIEGYDDSVDSPTWIICILYPTHDEVRREEQDMPLIHTDRSRQEDIFQDCQRAGYWKYYGGPTGFGILKKGAHIYMQTGLAFHEIAAKILTSIQLSGVHPSKLKLDVASKARIQIRGFIKETLDQYREVVERDGWADEEGDEKYTPEQRDTWLNEQLCLVEGMIWGWVKIVLPQLMLEFHLVTVEREEGVVVKCTCEVGDLKGTPEQHELLGCNGVLQASRPDFVMQRLDNFEVGIHDFKTVDYVNENTLEKHRNSVQMAVGTIGVEQRMGVPVTHYYVHAIQRGKRSRKYVASGVKGVKGDFSGPKMQQSDFCYVTYRASAPPLTAKESVTTEGKWYEKTPVWEIEFEEKPEVSQGLPISNVEWVVELLDREEVAANYVKIGPYDRQGYLIKGHLASMGSFHLKWNEGLSRVYQMVEIDKIPLFDALNEEVPQSWNCRKWNRVCEFWDICNGTIKPEQVMDSGEYELRIPHHIHELRAFQETTGQEVSALPEYPGDAPLLSPKQVENPFARVEAAKAHEQRPAPGKLKLVKATRTTEGGY